MKFLAKLATVWITALYMSLGQAASFDCYKAKSLVEKAICSSPQLSELDDSLALTYRDALVATNYASEVKTGQRKWITDIRNKCADSLCIAQAYQARESVLNSIVSASLYTGDIRSLMGTYDDNDKYGPGDLRLMPISSTKLKFELHSEYHQSNGNVNVGETDGTITLKDGVAVDKNDQCLLYFKFFPKNVTITQKGDCGFGMGVNVSGIYTQVNRAPPKFSQ